MEAKTITITDIFPSIIENMEQELNEAFLEYLNENKFENFSDASDFDNGRSFHEIIDSCVPIYTKDIKNVWFFHDVELEDAYSNMRLGDNPRENNGMSAIYCMLSEFAREWFEENANDIFENWKSGQGEEEEEEA